MKTTTKAPEQGKKEILATDIKEAADRLRETLGRLKETEIESSEEYAWNLKFAYDENGGSRIQLLKDVWEDPKYATTVFSTDADGTITKYMPIAAMHRTIESWDGERMIEKAHEEVVEDWAEFFLKMSDDECKNLNFWLKVYCRDIEKTIAKMDTAMHPKPEQVKTKHVETQEEMANALALKVHDMVNRLLDMTSKETITLGCDEYWDFDLTIDRKNVMLESREYDDNDKPLPPVDKCEVFSVDGSGKPNIKSLSDIETCTTIWIDRIAYECDRQVRKHNARMKKNALQALCREGETTTGGEAKMKAKEQKK